MKPFADALSKEAGLISFYHGVQVEDPAVGYLFVVWEAFENHQALIDSPAVYASLFELFKPTITGPHSIIHANFTADPTAALSAPATELSVFTVKAGGSKDVVDGILAKISSEETPGVRGAAYGPSVEKDDTLIFVVGWTSVEAHRELIKGLTPEKHEAIGVPLRANSEIDEKHVKLSKA